MSVHYYHINEFAVESEFALPHDKDTHSVIPVSDSNRITIRRASLAELPCLMRKIRRQMIYDVGDGFLLEPRVGPEGLALHIDFKGRAFTVDCADECLPVAAAWAIHAGLGAATVTRGGVPLHGAGLEVAGRYVALMAASGSGKSTLSWFLMQQGARFGNDDLVPVYLAGDEAIAYPSISLFPKLQREAVDRHGLDYAALKPADYGTGEDEYYVPMPPTRRVPGPAPLAAVFLLRPQPLDGHGLLRVERMADLVTAECLPEDEAAKTLWANLHALWLIGKWVDQRRIAALCQGLAARVPVYTLSYPKAYALLPALAAKIMWLAERGG